MENFERAKNLLKSHGYTCVLVKDGDVISSEERGIAPLMKIISSGKSVKGYALADKIVGKAVALLCIYAGITHIYAEVLSEPASEILKGRVTALEYGTLAERIINRRGDGICPMEQTVLEISDPEEAYTALAEKLKNM